jgi:hypothetical protein
MKIAVIVILVLGIDIITYALCRAAAKEDRLRENKGE